MSERHHGWPCSPRHVVFCFIAAMLGAACLLPLRAQTSIALVKQGFANPPFDAKPMMRWWWFGVAVDKAEILRELEEMKGDGIGGVELAFVYPQVVDDALRGIKNDRFLSPTMLESVRYAQEQARKLGLRVDVTLGSGWPYGGPGTTVEEAAGCLRVVELAVPPRATSLPRFKLEQGESVVSISLVAGEPQHWQAAGAQSVAFSQISSLAPAANSRTALVFLASHTGQIVKRAAAGAEGWVLDPFSRQAVATHLKTVAEPLIGAFGNTPPYAVFSDSLEAYGADWTPTLPEEFRRRRGYDLLPHLPELVAGGSPAAEKLRHDWGKTLTELVEENYLAQINDWAQSRHTRFRSQTYGEPAVSFSSQRLAALPEGEGPRWRAFSTLRWASSANHTFGNNVTSSEAFTWLHSPVFRATPLDMKAEADLHFLIGVNQIIGHGWPYSPAQAGEPGWSLYAAAALNDHNPWHPVMPEVSRYLQRMSYLLRQGEPANQVALLLPTDDGWAAFAPGRVSLSAQMERLVQPKLIAAILTAGYNLDFVDAEAIERQGIKQPLLLLPPTERIPLATLKKIERYVAAGGKVLAVGRAPFLDAEGERSAEIAELAGRLFPPSAVVAELSALPAALQKAVAPDFSISADKEVVGFIRRKLPESDIYFVANTSNRPVRATADFATVHTNGEQWNPDTGSVMRYFAGHAGMAIELAPYESTVFVFSEVASPPRPAPKIETQVVDLSLDWSVTFPRTGRSMIEHNLVDWTGDAGLKNYSGVGVYQREVVLKSLPAGTTFLEVVGGTPLPPDNGETGSSPPAVSEKIAPNPAVTKPGPGMRAWYDPPVREAAVVFLNGERAGALWHPPYRLDVTRYLKPGANYLEVRVYNTAINAWAALPRRDDKALVARYGDRFQMQDMDKVQPAASGLLGGVHLVSVR